MKTSERVKWVLASASPRRREILAGLGLQFEIHPSTVDEPLRRANEKPTSYAVRAAKLKAQSVGEKLTSGWVIGADTVVAVQSKLLGKPTDRQDARGMLLQLSGRWHEVVTGICLLNCQTGVARAAHTSSRVHFRRLTPRDIDWYLNTGEYSDKAGAYGIQGHASLFIDRIEGCYFNIVGFPVTTFERLCRKLGIDLSQHLKLPRPG